MKHSFCIFEKIAWFKLCKVSFLSNKTANNFFVIRDKKTHSNTIITL